MKPTELRIGNWVYSEENKEVTVLEIYDELISYPDDKIMSGCLVSEISPIPLTEEWLKKFGFKKTELGGNHVEYKQSLILIEYSKVSRLYVFDTGMRLVKVKYVLQLQNLYFALTGKELEIKN